MNTSQWPQSYPDHEPTPQPHDTAETGGPEPAAHQGDTVPAPEPPHTADETRDPEASTRPTGPSLPTMVMGLVLLVTAVAVGVIRLTDLAAGPPSWSWVVVVLGGVLVVAGLLGALVSRRDH